MTHLPAVVPQVQHHHRIADVVGGHADGSHLQRLGINAAGQLAPLTAQELDARGVEQQIQPIRTEAIRYLHIQTALSAT